MPLSEIAPVELQRMDAARLAPLVSSKRKPAVDDVREPAGDDDKEQFLSVRALRDQYLDYLTTKVDEIEEQKESRHYYHGAQWTPAQIKILRDRHQPPNTWNRVSRKINGIVGLVERMRSDPKAQPRSPKSEQGAEIATQSIRYVLDANEWKGIDPWCLLQCGIDGVAGVQMVLSEGDKGDPDISIPWVIGDEYFYDPKSYRLDFNDKRYDGIAKWLDLEEGIELFPDKEELLRSLMSGDSDMTTNADRDYKWVITASQRIRLVEHWYKHKGKWCWAFYVNTTLIDQGVSPFYDEKGRTISSFITFSAAVDHDGDRYGFVRNLKGPQDSLNQGKSKTMHIANTKLVDAEKGAVDDVEIARREVARPDGWIERNPGKAFQIVDTKADLANFVQFTEDAKNELDQYANVNMAIVSGAQINNISGRAIELLRQPGMAELGPFILAYRAWKLRLYRAIWNAVQRYWTAERWIRVSGNEELGKFIQLNGLGMDQTGRPAIVNAVGALDVDIILEEGPDIASLMQDTYDALKGYPPGTFPPQVLIELSSLPRTDKNRILQMLQPKPQQQDPAMELVKHLKLEEMAGKNAKQAAETERTHAMVDQIMATAAEKRAKATTESVRPAHMAVDTHLDAARFFQDSLREASGVSQAGQQQKPQQPAQPAQQQQVQPQAMPQPQRPPIPGARQARDGRHYIPDPRRPGKYLMMVA